MSSLEAIFGIGMENVTYSVLLVLGIITAAILFIWLFFTIYHTLMALEFRREYGVAIPAGLYIKKAKKIYVNELNTIPGSLSFYLWTPLKKEYTELLDDMINIAVKRYKKKLKKTTIFDSNILSSFNGSKGVKGMKGKLR